MPNALERTIQIRELAHTIGFQKVGVAEAGALPQRESDRYRKWIASGYHASMTYMEQAMPQRENISSLMKDARSIVCVAMNYYHTEIPAQSEAVVVSQYAHGTDYHELMGERLQSFAEQITELTGARCLVCVDTKPVAEKYWAQAAGLGWRGKHSNLITKDFGSWVFLGEVILDIPLIADVPERDHCGTCTKCIDACPTEAIIDPYVVDSTKCISYLTIEHRGDIEPHLHAEMGSHVFGCDICQDVCPWNRFAQETQEEGFRSSEAVQDLSADVLEGLSIEEFGIHFRGSPIKRAKQKGMVRNLRIAEKNA